MPSAQHYLVRKYREQNQTLRMLFIWKGSVYRNVLKQAVVWIIVYYILNCIYRFALSVEQKSQFENIVTDVKHGIEFVPLSFVLGFYANVVVQRYWGMWNNLPRPDTLALRISNCIPGREKRDQQIRRTTIRYVLLAIVFTFRKISKPFKEKYQSLDMIMKRGLLNEEEKDILTSTYGEAVPYWAPLVWAGRLFHLARSEKRIKDDNSLALLSSDLSHFRDACGRTVQVEQIGIPLAYSQVVVIACYTFWCGSIVARQWVDNQKVSQENYFPFFTLLQLVIFFGWLCSAEAMIHPFGDDDDDFHLVWLLDNYINGTYKMIDNMDRETPALVDDAGWDHLRQSTDNCGEEDGGGSDDEAAAAAPRRCENEGAKTPSAAIRSIDEALQKGILYNSALVRKKNESVYGAGRLGQAGSKNGSPQAWSREGSLDRTNFDPPVLPFRR